MLKRLHVRNFTVFEDAKFEFSPGLNVLVGTNGTGKSHVLKLGYAVEAARLDVESQYKDHPPQVHLFFGQGELEMDWVGRLPRILKATFSSWPVNLIRHRNLELPFEATATFTEPNINGELKFQISKDPISISGVMHLGDAPNYKGKNISNPVFIPAKEILTMMPDIIGLSEQYPDLLDATYNSLARKLTIRQLNESPGIMKPVLQALGEAMGGAVKAENGRFYLQPAEGDSFEISLVAEGYRKLGTLAYLLGNGAITKENTLYWDEPESNLNPALLRQLAELLVQLAAQGFQIILATHSLFLLKEFHILSRQLPAAQVRYFGLSAEPSESTRVTQVDNLELLPDIVALDAELEQSDRFQAVLDQEDADSN